MKKKGLDNFISFTGACNTMSTNIGSFDNNLSMFWDNMDSGQVDLSAEGDISVKCRMADGKSVTRKFNGKDSISEM